MRHIAVLVLAACGPATIVSPKILPPNTEAACDRAIVCGVFLPEQRDPCINCVETVADKWNAEAKAQFGDDLPPVESVPCEYVTLFAHKTHLSQCVVGRWYGP